MIKSELVIVRDKNNNPNIMRRYEKCLHREVDPSIEGDAVIRTTIPARCLSK